MKMNTKGMKMDTINITLTQGQDIASSNEWEFERKKCWIGGRFCIWAKGRSKLFGDGDHYELEVSAEAGATGLGQLAFTKRLPLAPKCYHIPLVSSLSMEVCFENLDLSKRRFTLVIRVCADLPVIGHQCVTVYEQDIVIGARSAVEKNILEAEPLPSGIKEFAFELIEDSGCCQNKQVNGVPAQPVLCFGYNPQYRAWTPLPSPIPPDPGIPFP